MRHQLPFKRVFTHDGVQWFRPVNSITNKHILEEIFKEMTYGNDNEVRTAYFAAMDVIRSSSSVRLLVFLQNGGLVALRNLINSCHLQNRGQATFGMALDILEGLLSVSIDVRIYLLRYWDMLLRPVKRSFAHFQRSHGFMDLKREFIPRGERSEFPDLSKRRRQSRLKEGSDSQRSRPIHDVALFSEYLRTLEIGIHTAPDSTPTHLKKVFLANKHLDPFHKTINDLKLKVPLRKADLVFGPRVDFVRQECLATPVEIVPLLKAYFNLDDDNTKQGDEAEELDEINIFKVTDEKPKAPEVATSCFDSIKCITLEPPPQEELDVPQLKFCQQLDDTNRLAAAHTLSHTPPSIVALINKNPLFFPSVRKLADPTGKLEDTALKIMKFKPPKIPQKNSEESESDQNIMGKANINLRISDINSAYGVEFGKIFDMCLAWPPFGADEGVEPSEGEEEANCDDDFSKSRTSQKPNSLCSDAEVPRDTLDASFINSVESYTLYLNRASIRTVDDLAKMIVRKALFGILEKPVPDIEGEVAKLCQDFCVKNGYSRYSLDSLAEAIVDKVLSCLTDPNAPPSLDRTVEDEIRQAIYQSLRHEEEERKRSKLPKIKFSQLGERRITGPSENTQPLPVLCFRKTIQVADEEKVIRELEVNSMEKEKFKVSSSFKGGVASQPGAKRALEDRQEIQTVQSGGKNTRPMEEARGGQSLEDSETSVQKPMLPTLVGVLKSTTSIPPDGSKKRSTFQLCVPKDQVAFNASKSRGRDSHKLESSSCEVLNQVFTNVAEQLSAQLEAIWNAQPSAESKEEEINRRALYVVQRVVSNLAFQMSAASTRNGETLEKNESVTRRAISITRKALSYSGIPPAFHSSDLGVKKRATYIVNRIVLGALKELSRRRNNSNQNAFEEDEEDDDPIPIVCLPRGISLARAIRTGRLAT
ncbi:hypothetical protein TcWFU_008220 [Taenia crassiceps]|uniref:Uncharacterized protein n=1 Tax=Taenia crassiceps TaxID=6207 RepID=A0ABR4Q576_9CEST